MVDFFLVLMLPGAGDELQGIKKGVLEIADMIAVNKADGEGSVRAGQAASEYRAIADRLRQLEAGVRDGEVAPSLAVEEIAGLIGI